MMALGYLWVGGVGFCSLVLRQFVILSMMFLAIACLFDISSLMVSSTLPGFQIHLVLVFRVSLYLVNSPVHPLSQV